uniref:Uncharacterized protein n=1 Tax=Laticauda laticaudata TaxID=8630 RepID=A0A8C5S546_LATLA
MFFEVNIKEHTSLQNLWNTTKAYLRGQTTAYIARKKKEKESDELQNDIRKLERQAQLTPENEQIIRKRKKDGSSNYKIRRERYKTIWKRKKK